MARDRDHRAVAARTLAEGNALLREWDAYVDRTRALAEAMTRTSGQEEQ